MATEIGLWISKDRKWPLLNQFKDPLCSVLFSFNGTIYTGTRKGLYSLKDGTLSLESLMLADKQINSISSDKDGRLWVGTMEGVYVKEEDRWNIYFFPEKYSANIINSIYQDRNGLF